MNMKKAAGLMFVAFGGAGLLAACGLEADSCTFDTDCVGAQVCYQTSCVNLCTTDDECLVDEECAPRPGGADGMVCQFKEVAPPEGCDDDPTICPEGTFCANNECIDDTAPPQVFYTVEIRDTSTGDSCTDVTYGYNTPGAKPMYAYLLDDAQPVPNILAYGTAVGANLLGETDYDAAFEIFDGSPPDYDGECPEAVSNYPRVTPNAAGGMTVNTNLVDDAVVALGCGGSLFLAFYDGGGRIPLENGQQVVIGEYGPFCKLDGFTHDPQSRDDFYAVNVCTSLAESIFESDTCTISLATNRTGIAIVDVAGLPE